MLQIMKEAGQKPTTKLYNTIMAGYFREASDIFLAFEVL